LSSPSATISCLSLAIQVWPMIPRKHGKGHSSYCSTAPQREALWDLFGARACALSQTVEVIGLRLYTGPMFALYNAKMRSFPTNIVEYLRLLGPRAFVTTLHAVNSGILKMARFSVVPGRPRPCRPCMNCLCVCEGVGCEGGREVQRVGEWVGPQLNLDSGCAHTRSLSLYGTCGCRGRLCVPGVEWLGATSQFHRPQRLRHALWCRGLF